MLTEVCAYLHNYFCEDEDKHLAEFTISGGVIAPSDFLLEGQYFRIVGSVMNDGVYRWPCSELQDETFRGAVWAMRVPPAVVTLANDIEEYNNSDQAKPSAYTSESFGGYSYSKASGANGCPATWQDIFQSRLKPHKKVRE